MMQASILPRYPMTKRLREVVDAALGEIPVGLGAAPRYRDPRDPKAMLAHEPPYVIVFPLWRTSIGGPVFVAPDADQEWIYQLSAYAKRTDQLEIITDKLYDVALGRDAKGAFKHPLLVPGVRVMDRVFKDDSGGDGEPQGDILTNHVRVGLRVTPSSS